jgi:hypothetical protein
MATNLSFKFQLAIMPMHTLSNVQSPDSRGSSSFVVMKVAVALAVECTALILPLVVFYPRVSGI